MFISITEEPAGTLTAMIVGIAILKCVFASVVWGVITWLDLLSLELFECWEGRKDESMDYKICFNFWHKGNGS